jgi:hypothetical protein
VATAGSAAERERERQARSNRHSLSNLALFASHRARLTEAILERLAAPGGARLCVLGAGNCHDLELARLAERYREIHLVDLDEQAIQQARDRQPLAVRERLVLHASLDLSQMLVELDGYRALELTPERLARHPELASERLVRALGAGFDAVVSACVLSQMQLALRTELSDEHPLFSAASYTLSLTHLRTLSALLSPGGRALLVSDAANEQMAPLGALDPDANLLELLVRLVLAGDVFHSVDPLLLSQMSLDDPTLASDLSVYPIRDVWLWQLTAERRYLVYALLLERNGLSAGVSEPLAGPQR